MINCERIKELMGEREIKNKDLAARVGISDAMMSYILDGLREPNVRTLVHIANALECTVDSIVIR